MSSNHNATVAETFEIYYAPPHGDAAVVHAGTRVELELDDAGLARFREHEWQPFAIAEAHHFTLDEDVRKEP